MLIQIKFSSPISGKDLNILVNRKGLQLGGLSVYPSKEPLVLLDNETYDTVNVSSSVPQHAIDAATTVRKAFGGEEVYLSKH